MKIWRRMWRTNKIGTIAFVYIIFTILVGLFANVLAPADPYKMSVMKNLKPPSLKHWSGTDRYGRDVLSRVIHGTRLTLKVGFLAVLGSTVIGTILGLSSVLSRILNTVLMRLVDVLMSLPGIFLALALVALMGPSEWTVIVALTYGVQADWAQNVLTGPATIELRAHTHQITVAEVVGRDETWGSLPRLVRCVLRVLGIRDFLRLSLSAPIAS